jgi:hypothetical membrane protein
MPTSDHHRIGRIAALAGLLASASAISGAAITGVLYTGRTKESYSIFNHFISELGNYTWSRYAIFFNTGLILAGLALIFFLYASAMLLRDRTMRYLLMFMGTLSGIFCSLVGVFSETYMSIHLTVAPAFFVSIFISVAIYCVAIWRQNGHHLLDRRFALAGVPAAISLMILIYQISVNAEAFLLGPKGAIFQTLYHRPEFWSLPFVEWMVFLSLLGMVAFFSLHLLMKTKKRNQIA